MLIVKEGSEAVWCDRTIRGFEVRLMIRPRNEDFTDRCSKKHTKYEFVKGVKVPVSDNRAFLEDLIDYYLVDFQGIGTAKDKPWPVDKKHKMKVAMMPVIGEERPVFDFIMEKSLELSFADDQEAQELEQD